MLLLLLLPLLLLFLLLLLTPSIDSSPHHAAAADLAAGLVQAGALVAGVVFALTSDQGKFYISAFCGLVGVVCTFLFIPDISGLDLREGDRRWIKNVEGKGLHDKSSVI